MTENLWTKIQKIQYRGTPVFGRDSKPQNTSEFVALTGTVLFWLLLFLFLIFARPFAKKPEYKTVQIVLSSTPVAKTEKKESAASSAAAQKAQSTEKKIEKQDVKTVKEQAAKPKAENKPKSGSKTVKKSNPVKQPEPTFEKEYYDPMEAFNNQLNQQVKKDYGDYDPFASTENTVEQTAQSENRLVTTDNSFEGEVGQASRENNTGAISESDNNSEENIEASNRTLDSLGKIMNTFPGSAGNSEIKAEGTKTSNNQVEGFGGSGRTLLSKPDIPISEKMTEDIKNIKIVFTVLPNGTVSNIIINDPRVKASIKSEIEAIIKTWLFTSGQESRATLNFSILREK